MKKLSLLTITLLIATGMAVAQASGSGSAAGSGTAASTSSGQASGSTAASDQATTPQTDQSATPAANPDQNATGQAGAADQNGANGQRKGGRLPQTGSPLPLLALLGAGATATGVITRKRKK